MIWLIWVEIGGLVVLAFFLGMIMVGARDWWAIVGAIAGLVIAATAVLYALAVGA